MTCDAVIAPQWSWPLRRSPRASRLSIGLQNSTRPASLARRSTRSTNCSTIRNSNTVATIRKDSPPPSEQPEATSANSSLQTIHAPEVQYRLLLRAAPRRLLATRENHATLSSSRWPAPPPGPCGGSGAHQRSPPLRPIISFRTTHLPSYLDS